MPIRIPDELPARATLEAEGVMVMGEADAVRQDIRPLRVGLLNLMPDKISTETQIARLVGSTPLQVELTLVRMAGNAARNTPSDHMTAFYRPWEEVRDETFDGFIITGAPVEHLPFEQVLYWDEFRQVMDWSQTHVHRLLTICWAALAAVHHFHGLEKRALDSKAWGVVPHRNLAPASPFLRGFADEIPVPVSRWSEVTRADIEAAPALSVLLDSSATGPCLIDDPAHHALHMFNHLEYDTHTLGDEYRRDAALRGEVPVPVGYFPENDPGRPALNSWRSHAHLLFGNWINEMYQTTPFDIRRIGEPAHRRAAA